MRWLRRHKTLFLVIGEILSFTWVAASLVLDFRGVVPGLVDFRLSALVGLFVFATLMGAHLYSLHRRLSPKIDLVLGDFPSCVHTFTIDGRLHTLLRVGLVNKGGETISNVSVSLETISPQGSTFTPIKLLFMHQRSPHEEHRLHPGDSPTLFVDVVQDGYTGSPPSRVFTLPFAVAGVPNVIKPGPYKLTLLAEGDNVQPCRKHYSVSWDGHQIQIAHMR
jgi:hypothetical protein